MKKLSRTSVAFFDYVGGLRKYFGSEVLSSLAFFVLYLNYDTENNVIRRAIISMIPQADKVCTWQAINGKCVDFIVKHRENAAVKPAPTTKTLTTKKAIASKEEIATKEADAPKTTAPTKVNSTVKNEYFGKNVVISDRLYELFSKVKHDPILDKLMYNLYFEDEASCISELFTEFMTDVFGIELLKLKEKISAAHRTVVEKEDKIQPFSEEDREYLSIVDGRRENYKLDSRHEVRGVIWMVMQKRKRTNVVLSGDMATGKTALINSLAYQIAHKECDPIFYDCNVIRVKLLNVFTNNLTPNDIACKLKEIVQTLINFQAKAEKQIIVFLDDFYCTFAVQENGLRFYYLLMPLLLADNIFTILTCSSAEDEVLAKDQNLYKNVIGIAVEEPEKDEMVSCIRPSTYPLIIYHGVNINDEWISKAVLYTRALYRESVILGGLDILDCSMANASRQGRTALVLKDIVDYFVTEFKNYHEQSDEIKMLTAYHEAGHFVVSRFCKYYTSIYSDLITIVPSEDAGGFNWLEYDGSKQKSYGYNFHLEGIACLLGGRASEELFIGSVSSGAESDLQEATKSATSMVSILGLDNVDSRNDAVSRLKKIFTKKSEFAIKGNENLRSEKSINSVSEKVDVLMDRAYQIALKQLKKHEDYVHVLVSMLLNDKIVARDDILKREYKGEDGIVRLKA